MFGLLETTCATWKDVCITINLPEIKSIPNPDSNPTTKQQAIVNIQLNKSHVLYVSREIRTRLGYCTFLFNNFPFFIVMLCALRKSPHAANEN